MKLLSKYKKQPEGDELDELFEQTLDDINSKDEDIQNLKWLFIQNQMKQNIQGSFTIISTLDVLKSVFYSFSSFIQ